MGEGRIVNLAIAETYKKIEHLLFYSRLFRAPQGAPQGDKKQKKQVQGVYSNKISCRQRSREMGECHITCI